MATFTLKNISDELYARDKGEGRSTKLVMMDEAQQLLMGRGHDTDSATVVRLAADSDRTAYDCGFVEVAMRLRVPLVTMDAKLRRMFAGATVSLAEA